MMKSSIEVFKTLMELFSYSCVGFAVLLNVTYSTKRLLLNHKAAKI